MKTTNKSFAGKNHTKELKEFVTNHVDKINVSEDKKLINISVDKKYSLNELLSSGLIGSFETLLKKCILKILKYILV